MGFWEDEDCEYCHGPLVEKRVEVPRKAGAHYILFKGVPVGICRRCGNRYYAANVLKIMQSVLSGKIPTRRKIPMAVYSL